MFGNDFFDELGSYKNIMLFQISSRRESRENLSHQDESSYKNFLQTIRYRIQHLGAITYRIYLFTFAENTTNNSPKVTWVRFLRKDRFLLFY